MLAGSDVVSHPVIEWHAGLTEHIISPKYNFIEVTLTYLSLSVYINQSFSEDNCWSA